MSFHIEKEPLCMTTEEKLDKVLEILVRIEERQKRTTAMVEDVSKEAPIGSFGTIDTGEK